jgi:hypothetical protein
MPQNMHGQAYEEACANSLLAALRAYGQSLLEPRTSFFLPEGGMSEFGVVALALAGHGLVTPGFIKRRVLVRLIRAGSVGTSAYGRQYHLL